MGNAKARGDYETRKAEAIAAGRVKAARQGQIPTPDPRVWFLGWWRELSRQKPRGQRERETDV